MTSWYFKTLSDYTNFEGRASRTEFWMFFLFHFLAALACIILDNFLDMNLYKERFGWLSILYVLGTALPTIAIHIRRVRDSENNPLFLFLACIPYVGFIALIILMALKGTKGDNKYGPEPPEEVLSAE